MSIDLRGELNQLLRQEIGGIGRWVIIRHFTDEHSEFWKPEAHEAIGGPAYKFIDTVVETYSAPALARTALKNEGIEVYQPGQIEQDFIRFFLEHDVSVLEDDEIYELNYEKLGKPTVVYDRDEEDIANGKVAPKERYKIKKVETYRADEGRVEYQVAYALKTILR